MMNIAPDYALMDVEKVFKAFDTVLRKLAVAAKLSGIEYPFKNTVAQSTSLITIDLQNEAENYGMCKSLYERMISYKKKNSARYESIIDEGNWCFTGSSGYKRMQIVIKISQDDSVASFIPATYFPSITDIVADLDISVVVEADPILQTAKKSKFRGPGVADFTSSRTPQASGKKISEKIVEAFNEGYSPNASNRSAIFEAAVKEARIQMGLPEPVVEAIEESYYKQVINSIKSFLGDLSTYGRNFAQSLHHQNIILAATAACEVNDVQLSGLLGVNTKSLVKGKEKRILFNAIVQEEEAKTFLEEDNNILVGEIESGYDGSSDSSVSDGNDSDNNNAVDKTVIPNIAEGRFEIPNVAKNKLNCFRKIILRPKRKERADKNNLQVVRDYSHEECRPDTFNTYQKVLVHEYDGTIAYHKIHIRNHSINEYFLLFEKSIKYKRWQDENKRIKKKRDGTEVWISPTIRYRSFRNSFCTCCLSSQKQRDCANFIQVNLTNALKALGKLRKLLVVANAMKTCGCAAHRNEEYMKAHTSVNSFINCMLCPQVEYPELSGPPKEFTRDEIEAKNIQASLDKELLKAENMEGSSNRNSKREKPLRQSQSIPTCSWGHLYKIHRSVCGHLKCPNPKCGVVYFFSEANMCNAERNPDCFVTVRRYEDIPGRSRGVQKEIVEVEMNGVELMEWIQECAKAAIPHMWDDNWNTHARQLCLNNSDEKTLNVMCDYSALLSHMVQDNQNSAVPARSNQGVFLCSHSPKMVPSRTGALKRIQENDCWHFWSAVGGTLETNSYQHMESMLHLMKHYEYLELEKLNVFTDGCGEQYKNRRNAWLIAWLAFILRIIIAHLYAPTATFKTLVDGQGDVTKAKYRDLENKEVEGTRCPTTWHLFKLFTSKYPMTPQKVEDADKQPMTITRRYHRFLVDIADATPEMTKRAEEIGGVIITDYIAKRWDAPKLKKLKSLFALYAAVEDGAPKLFSRDHACFCIECSKGNFKGCLYPETSGILNEEKVEKLPWTPPGRKKSYIDPDDILVKQNFFNGNILQTDDKLIIVVNHQEPEDPFTLGVMTKKIIRTQKDYDYEYIINGAKNVITIEKGTLCVTVKIMTCRDQRLNEYYIPPKLKEIKMPLSSVYFSESYENLSRDSYLPHIISSEHQLGTKQSLQIFKFNSNCLDSIREDLCDESII